MSSVSASGHGLQLEIDSWSKIICRADLRPGLTSDYLAGSGTNPPQMSLYLRRQVPVARYIGPVLGNFEERG